MKILITGGSGLLGQYLNISLSKSYNIFTLYNKNIGNCADYSSKKVDLTKETVEEIFQSFKPDVIIHTAAFTSTISDSTISKKYIYELNVNVTKAIAELCVKFNSKMIYISTDLVYAGYRGSLLSEDAKLIPASVYAETKLMGEVKIKETFKNYIILRTALLIGFGLNHSKCHFQHMYDYLKSGNQVKLFTDQYRSPISLIEASEIISLLIKKNISCETINLGGGERISRFELGEILCSMAGLNKNLLIKAKMDQVTGLPNVEDVSLNVDKLKSYGIKLLTIEESIKNLLAGKS